jgi:hypothetical protein
MQRYKQVVRIVLARLVHKDVAGGNKKQPLTALKEECDHI